MSERVTSADLRAHLCEYWHQELTKGLALSIQLEVGERIRSRVEHAVADAPDATIALITTIYAERLPLARSLASDAMAELVRKSHGSDPPPSPENTALKEALMLYERSADESFGPPDVKKLIDSVLQPPDELDEVFD